MTSRRIYENPPVHEVVLDLQFEGVAAIDRLREFPESSGVEFGEGHPLTRVTNHTLLGPRGVTNRAPEQSFWGWEFSADDPRRLVTVSANQVSQHFIRSANWPEGSYVGWEKIAESFRAVLERAAPLFETLTIRRAGLRYINRVAVSASTMLEEWFSVVPEPLEGVHGLWDFRVSRTWEAADDFPGLSATVTLGKSDVGGTEIDPDEVLGVVLDIDVFNLWVKDAPDFGEVGIWIEQAHLLENRIFESCITPSLAERFNPAVAT